MSRTFVGLALLLSAVAQAQTGYRPAPYTAPAQAWKDQLAGRRDKWVADIPDTLQRVVQREVADRRVEQYEDLLESAEDSMFIYSGPLKEHLDAVLAQLQAANPDVPRDIDLVVARYPWPNASCMGQGTLLFNTGLLERMEHDAQIAFVLGHELAHQRMDHVGRHMVEMLYKAHTKEFKRELRAANHQEYQRTKRLRTLLAGFYSPARRHGREHESQADSLALVWTLRAGYDPAQALATMDILDHSDDERVTDALDLARIFDRPGYRFQAEWTTYGGASSLGHFEEEHTALDDSLKTHPDCAQRKGDLERQLAGLHVGTPRPDPAELDALVRAGGNECIEAYLVAENYGRAMFLALCGLRRDSTDLYLHAIVSRCFSGMHQRSVTHELGKVLDHPSDEYADNYDRLLAFLNNLHQKDYAELALHYLDPWRASAPDNEDLICADALANRAVGRSPEAHTLAGRYTTLYPNGRFARTLAGIR